MPAKTFNKQCNFTKALFSGISRSKSLEQNLIEFYLTYLFIYFFCMKIPMATILIPFFFLSQIVCSILSRIVVDWSALFCWASTINFKRIHCPNSQFSLQRTRNISSLLTAIVSGSFSHLVFFGFFFFSVISLRYIFLFHFVHRPVSSDIKIPNSKKAHRIKKKK